jgi:hypothetical protein
MQIFYTRTKYTLALSVVGAFLLVLVGTHCGMIGRRNDVGTVDAQTTNDLPANKAAVTNDFPPFETARAYWKLSKDGDLQAVNAMITKAPNSYWIECEETPSSKAFKERNAKRNARLPRIEPPEYKNYNYRDDFEAKSLELLKKHSKDLWTSQFQDLEFVDQKVYGDEAMVFTKFRISDNYYGNPVFYMTRSDGIWKIFLEGNRDYGHDETDYYYAAPRPKCPDK